MNGNSALVILLTSITAFAIACTPRADAPSKAAAAGTPGESAPQAPAKPEEAAQPGGQPGTVIIGGAMMINGVLDSHFRLTQFAGSNSKNRETELAKDAFVIKTDLMPSEKDALTRAQADSTFVRLGCDADVHLPAFPGLTEAKVDLSFPIVNIVANTVVLCGGARDAVTNDAISIVAKIVYSNAFGFTITGNHAKSFSIVTQYFGVNAGSSVTSETTSLESSPLGGPQISIWASDIQGDGEFRILSRGADFKKAD